MGPMLYLREPELAKLGLADLMLGVSASYANPAAYAKAGETISYFRKVSNACDLMTGVEVFPHGAVHGNRFSLPGDLFRRTLTTQPGSTGGFLVGTDNADFIGNVRDRDVLSKLPVTRLDGLQGNVSLPRGAGSATASWQATDTTAVTPSGITLGSVSMTPRSLICTIEFSGQLLKTMGSAANDFALGEIRRAAAEAMGNAFFNGVGGSEPVGIFNVPGITVQSGTSLTWASTLGMLKIAEQSAEDDSLVWVIAPDAAKLLRARERASGNGGFVLSDGTIAGYRCIVSGAVPDGALVIAPWSNTRVATWRSAQLDITPFSSSANFNAGIIAARLIVETDFAVGQPAQVAVATSIT